MQDLFDDYADSLERYEQSSNIFNKLKTYSEYKSCEKRVKEKICNSGRDILKKACNHFPSKLCMQLIG